MILDIIKEIRSSNSRTHKEGVLKKHINNELLKRVLVAAYDPNVNYWIKKIPAYVQTDAPVITLENALDEFLAKVADRTYTGNQAIDLFVSTLELLNEDDAEVLKLIIERDMKAGFSESTINKIWKGLVPTTPYCRCSGLDDLKTTEWVEGMYSQTKKDGLYLNINVMEDDTVDIFTRNGTRYDASKFPQIIEDLKHAKGQQFHGELLVKEDGKILPRQLGNGVLNSVASGGSFESNQTPFYVSWDTIPISECITKGYSTQTYKNRYLKLQELLKDAEHVAIVETRIVYNMTQALEHYREKLLEKEEGTVLKRQTMLWRDGTSKDQFKLKMEEPVDLIVVGYKEGKGKNAVLFGSLTCQTSDGLLEVNISGFTDEMRARIWFDMDDYIGKIVRVIGNGVMFSDNPKEKHSIFLPRFDEFRTDKTEADSFERVVQQFDNEIKLNNTSIPDKPIKKGYL